MFTGIVASVGRIESVRPIRSAQGGSQGGSDAGEGSGVRLSIDAGGLDLADVAIGDSILVQGACMTAVAIEGRRFEVDVSAESLRLTQGLDRPGRVNLEKSLRLADRLGGHLVSGHVDGLGTVLRFDPVGESMLLEVLAPAAPAVSSASSAPMALGRYLAYKGSITINGVSLTVNSVADGPEGTRFTINLIPHTVKMTTLDELRPGMQVNLEVDTVARYVARMLEHDHGPLRAKPSDPAAPRAT